MSESIELKKRSPEDMAAYFSLKFAEKQAEITTLRAQVEERDKILMDCLQYISRDRWKNDEIHMAIGVDLLIRIENLLRYPPANPGKTGKEGV